MTNHVFIRKEAFIDKKRVLGNLEIQWMSIFQSHFVEVDSVAIKWLLLVAFLASALFVILEFQAT